MRVSKRHIRHMATASGFGPLSDDVATVSKDRRKVTLRHQWDNETPEVQHAVMNAARRLACHIARDHGHDVYVCTASGKHIDVIEAASAAGRWTALSFKVTA